MGFCGHLMQSVSDAARVYIVQLVTPRVVAMAVITDTTICRMVFQVSFFMMWFPFFLVDNLVSLA